MMRAEYQRCQGVFRERMGLCYDHETSGVSLNNRCVPSKSTNEELLAIVLEPSCMY